MSRVLQFYFLVDTFGYNHDVWHTGYRVEGEQSEQNVEDGATAMLHWLELLLSK